MQEVTVAVVSMCSKADLAGNLKKAKGWVEKAIAHGANWILLPEIFHYIGDYSQYFAMAEAEDICNQFAKIAKDSQVTIVLGSLGERASQEGGKDGIKQVYNTTFVINKRGQVQAKYRKTHLFNLFSEKGEPLFCESDAFLPGDKKVTTELDGFTVGLSICYDLRFSGLYQSLNRGKPMDVIFVPSAFTQKTGEAHWELLLRARAVEYQCYVVAANQTGRHDTGKESFGHSMIVDPWGEVLANTGEEEGVAMACLSKKRIQEVRSRLPALANRRPELYERG